MLNVCLFGSGRMGKSHASYLQMSGFARLSWVVDLDLDKARSLAVQYGAKFGSDPEQALADNDIDCVLIATPTKSHVELIIRAANAKKPIFCEKPISLSLKLTDEAITSASEMGVPLFVAFNRRFDPSFSSLKRRLAEHEIGDIQMISLTSRDYPFPSVDYLKTSGGMFHDMTIHDFDMARYLLDDEPIEVYTAASCLIEPALESFCDVDTAMITLKTASGILCHINNSRLAPYGYDQRIEVFGSKGMLTAQNLAPTTVERFCASGTIRDNPYPSFPERYRQAYQNELEHFFVDVIKGGKKPLVTGFDARQALVIADAASCSLKKGAPQSIPIPMTRLNAVLH